MNQTTRTLVFVAVAGVSVASATMTSYLLKPSPLSEFEKVGTDFYPDFEDPQDATVLELAAVDETTGELQEFKVAAKDGVWSIPSHHDYPAEAKDRLAETATSMIGVKREALAGRRKSEHERFGVVDPSDRDAAVDGRGKKLTLRNADDQILVSFIIGHQVPNTPGDANLYYVRQANEDETYKAKIDVKLSTKFSDWIEPDLLKLNRDDLTALTIDRHQVDESRGQILIDEVNKLSRGKWSDPWVLDGIDEEAEEVDTDVMRDLVSALDDLKIVGVRPKPKGVNPDLTVELPAGVANNPRVRAEFERQLLGELRARGFFPLNDENGKRRVYSREGEVIAATSKGVVYHLHFGNLFAGSVADIEIGDGEAAASSEGDDDEDENGDDDADADSDGEEGDDEASEDGSGDDEGDDAQGTNRYLMIRIEFDESYIADRPVKPTEPEPPAEGGEDAGEDAGTDEPADDDAGDDNPDNDDAGDEPADQGVRSSEAEANAANADAESEAQDGEQAGDDGDQDEAEEGEEGEDTPEPPDPQAVYEAAKKQYEADLRKYETDLKAFDDKVKEGKEQVKELNQRIANWYYVISSEEFKQLRLSRDQLTKEKEKPETTDDGEEGSADDADAGSEDAASDGGDDAEAGSDAETGDDATSDDGDAGSDDADGEESGEETSKDGTNNEDGGESSESPNEE